MLQFWYHRLQQTNLNDFLLTLNVIHFWSLIYNSYGYFNTLILVAVVAAVLIIFQFLYYNDAEKKKTVPI